MSSVNSLKNTFVDKAPFSETWLNDETQKFVGKYAVNKRSIGEEEEM